MILLEKSSTGNYLLINSKYPAFYVQIVSSDKDFKVENNFFNIIPGNEIRVKITNGNTSDIKIDSLWNYINKNN